jgi:hypothetical protein
LFLIGKYLRRNPLARAGFIFYLIIIHLWSFVILFFHAHSFQEHGDFGASVGVSHGPYALLMQHQQLNPSSGSNGDVSGALSTPKGVVTQKLDSKSNEGARGEGDGHERGKAGSEEKEAATAFGESDRDVGKEGS